MKQGKQGHHEISVILAQRTVKRYFFKKLYTTNSQSKQLGRTIFNFDIKSFSPLVRIMFLEVHFREQRQTRNPLDVTL